MGGGGGEGWDLLTGWPHLTATPAFRRNPIRRPPGHSATPHQPNQISPHRNEPISAANFDLFPAKPVKRADWLWPVGCVARRRNVSASRRAALDVAGLRRREPLAMNRISDTSLGALTLSPSLSHSLSLLDTAAESNRCSQQQEIPRDVFYGAVCRDSPPRRYSRR